VAIRDSILTHLKEQSAEVLYLPSGKIRLKEEIRKTIDGEMRGEVVRNVFFTQFVIQ
jgi:flagellar basal body-associated protein FliL